MGSIPKLPPLLVRADADRVRGSGHVMRCLALVQAWIERDGKAFFLSRCVNDTMRSRMQECGASFFPLSVDASREADLEATLALAAEAKANFIALDGYDFDLEYHQALRVAGHCLMVIDDNIHLPRYEADIILNQNLGAARSLYNVNPEAMLLLGPEYALLRREFASWRSRLHTVPETARKILVTFGGSDPENVTLKALEGLRQLKIARLQIRVVVGPDNPHTEALHEAAASFPGKLELFPGISDMAPLMAWADLAVTGAGSTCWELSCLGLPAITLVVADNQIQIAERLAASGAVFNLGWHANVSPERLANAVDGLLFSSFRRMQMSKKGRALVDGKGAERVVATLSSCSAVRAA